MRPRLLEIEGFNSFKQKRSIDFSDLQIFSITGENGAGKSSLLEAIVFALYGETPRFVREKRELVSLGSNELNVLFEFSIGKSIYRVGRRFKLKGAPYVSVEQMKKGEWVTLGEGESSVEDQIQKIIRMSARAFMQAVIIPQGRFDDFLRPARPKDRTDTLTEMFHLEIYEKMRQKAADIANRAKEEIARLTSELGGFFADATAETLRQLKEKRKELKNNEKALQDKSKELKELVKRMTLVIETKNDLHTQREKVESKSDELNIEDRKHQTNLKEYEKWQKNEEPKIENHQSEVDALPEILQNLKELGRSDDQLRKIKTKIEDVEEELKLLVKSFETDQKALNGHKKIHELSRKELMASPFKEDLWEQLNSFQSDANELRRLRQEMKDNEAARTEMSEDLPKLQDQLNKIESSESKLGISLQESEEKLRLNDRILHIHELQSGLHTGDECPVCKSEIKQIHHPSQTEKSRLEHDTEKHLDSVKNCKRKLDELTHKRGSLGNQLAECEKQIKKKKEAGATLMEKATAIEKKINKHFSIPPKEDIAIFLKNEFAEQEGHRKKHQKLAEVERDLSTQVQRAQSAVERKESDITRTKADLENLASQLKECKFQIDTIRNDKEVIVYLRKSYNVRDAVESAQNRQNQIRAILKSLREKGRFLQSTMSESAGKIKALAKNLDTEQNHLQKLQDNLSKFSKEETKWDKAHLKSAEKEYEAASEEQQKLNRELGQVISHIEKLEERIDQVANLNKQKKDAEKRRDLYSPLASFLEVRQLQKFVVGKLLETLVENANVYLSDLTENKYQLHVVKEDLAVRDMWNGGVERSTKGLSGGETFVISLALALALSSAIGHGVHIESLFLDEGFGSLDKGRLELVKDALLKLPQYEKVVGVVTHIDDFAKAFPNQFLLLNSADGTQVTRLGENA